MKMKRIDVAQADQLGVCTIASLMGVLTPKNLIQEFLSMTRIVMQNTLATLTLQDETNIWQHAESGFKGYHLNHQLNLSPYFISDIQGNVIDVAHKHYPLLIKDLHEHGFKHEQLIAFDLKNSEQPSSYGQLILFDDSTQVLNTPERIKLIEVLVDSFIRNIELRLEFNALDNKYQQQCRLNQSKTKFFQIIAHDLRAPFHGLLGFSEILVKERDNLDANNIQEMTEYLYDTAQSTYNLLENLLNWAMSEGGNLVFQPVDFSLNQSSKVVYKVLNAIAQKKNIKLIEDIADELRVYADQNMVTSVIQNLVSNALKFTPVDGTGKVYISAEQKNETIEISVRDTGLGMSESQILSISQPDVKMSLRGTLGEKGTGLGLVLCKRFIDLNRGELIVSSKEGVGTTVKVILPIAQTRSRRLLKS